MCLRLDWLKGIQKDTHFLCNNNSNNNQSMNNSYNNILISIPPKQQQHQQQQLLLILIQLLQQYQQQSQQQKSFYTAITTTTTAAAATTTTTIVHLQEVASSFRRFAAKDFRLGEAEHVDEPLRAEDDVSLQVRITNEKTATCKNKTKIFLKSTRLKCVSSFPFL